MICDASVNMPPPRPPVVAPYIAAEPRAPLYRAAFVSSPSSARPVSHVTPPTDSSTGIVCAPRSDEFAPHFAKLGEIAKTPSLWPADGKPPSNEAIALARWVLLKFRDYGLTPSRVVASAEGGVAICIVKGGKYSDIECLDSGAILAVNSDKKSLPDVWEVKPDLSDIAMSISRIRRFIIG
jgi:hypothetical protein